MRRFLASGFGLGLLVMTSLAWASADELDNKTSAKWGKAQAAGPNASASDPAADQAPSTNRATSSGSTGGYSYSDTPTRSSSSAPARAMPKHKGPLVHLPGFEQTGDGGSRLFVALSAKVAVEEHKAQGSITYVLKNAGARVWNNTNALVTAHFNTPVSRAKIVPHGQDVHFVVELRAAAAPTWKITEADDKSAMLVIDFPKGEYLNGPEPAPAAAAATQPAAKKRAARVAPAAKRAAPATPPKPAGPTP